jgi:ABC-2 type transport system ATP-binding protein
VFLSSHLMSETELTADHLIVVGWGRLLRDMPIAEFHRRGRRYVRTSPLTAGRAAAGALGGPGRHGHQPRAGHAVRTRADRRGDRHRAAAASLTLFELTTVRSSLEAAYLEITKEPVEYRGMAE